MTPEEINQLQLLIRDEANTAELDELLQAAYTNPSLAVNADYSMEEIFAELMTKTSRPPQLLGRQAPVRHLFWRRITVAASILLIVCLGSYFLFFNKSKPTEIVKTRPQDVEAPKATKAMITLANGKTVALDSINSGMLATQGNVNVVKTADGKIVYNGRSTEVVYNTLYNPRGSQVVNLTLGDGSIVWLNAESSLKYPVAFIGKERKVEITGEAYFEVVHNAARPFIVKKDDAEISVLGTHFNINAYDDERVIKTTLLEGSVKVSRGNKTSILKPGQQAQLANNEIKIESADVDEVMAWKNGLFKYNNSDIGTVMRQISKWYDVTVSYPNGLPKDRYGGSLHRDLSLANVFKVLEETGAHFSIDGKNVKVLP
jgi:transmembrane sensor